MEQSYLLIGDIDADCILLARRTPLIISSACYDDGRNNEGTKLPKRRIFQEENEYCCSA